MKGKLIKSERILKKEKIFISKRFCESKTRKFKIRQKLSKDYLKENINFFPRFVIKHENHASIL